MDRIDSELQKNISDTYTPETLAWHLLVNDDLNNLDVGQLLASIDLESEPNPQKYNKEAYEFEILLTIYLEMVFGWFKLLHLMENEESGIDTEFNPKLNLVTLHDLENPFMEKFEIIGYKLHINEITNMDYYEVLRNKSYCRVALRDLKSDEGFFKINAKNIEPEKRYHFIMNSNYSGEKNIKNIYMVLMLNDKGYKISFSNSIIF